MRPTHARVCTGVYGLLLGAVAVVQAATTPPATYTISTAPADWSGSFTVAQFNLPAVSLDKVTIKLTGNMTSPLLQVENTSTIGGGVLVEGRVKVDLLLPGGPPPITSVTPNMTLGFTASPFDLTLDYGGTSGATASGSPSGAFATWDTTNPADLALFLGAGNIVLGASATKSTIVWASPPPPGSVTTLFSASSDASIDVTYTYTPVPEPAEVAMFAAVGLLGFVTYRRFANR